MNFSATRFVTFTGLIVLSVSLFLGLGCTRKESSQSNSQTTTGQNRVVNLAIWSNYIPDELVQEFQKKTGIQVQISNYSSNEELLAKLQAGASGFDVVIPSDYMISAMIHLKLLRELDFSKLTNFKSIDPKFLKKPYDPENKFSVPYDWGTTGIAVNRSLYPGIIKGWKDLLTKEDLAGKMSLLDDGREVLGAGLKALGYSLNSKNPSELQQSKELLLKARSRVKAFTSEPLMPLVNGETAVAHIFMSDALIARKRTQGKVQYIIPEEGATLWVDSLVIPTGSKNIEEAHRLINFLLEGKSNAATVMSVFVAPANKDAYALLPKELTSDPALFPPASVLSKCEMLQDLGENMALWDRMWTEIKAYNP